MGRPAIPTVTKDFDNVLAFFIKKGITKASPGTELISAARRMHRATFSLVLWRFRLTGIPNHGRVFIEEIASDALQILPQALMGYNKTTKMLTRGVVENCIRHIYFADHPIEFWRMNREAKWYRTLEDLFEYALVHPTFIDIEKRFDAINKLKNLYNELSAGVHGRRVQDLEMRTALNKIAFSKGEFDKNLALAERCAEATNFALVMFHAERVRGFQREDKQILLSTIRRKGRQVIAGLI